MVQRLIADTRAYFYSFQADRLGFFQVCNGFRYILQRYAAKADKTIRVFLNDGLNRFVLQTGKISSCLRFIPIEKQNRRRRDRLQIDLHFIEGFDSRRRIESAGAKVSPLSTA